MHCQVYFVSVCLLPILVFILTIKMLLKSVAKPQGKFNEKLFYAIVLIPYLKLTACRF